MFKKVLALICATALLVCAASVFTVVTVSAAAELTFDEFVAAETATAPVKSDDFITSQGKTTSHLKNPGTTGVTGFWKTSNTDGSLHCYVGSPGTLNFDWRTANKVAVDGAHIVVGNFSYEAEGTKRMALTFSETSTKYTAILQFINNGQVFIRDGSGAFTFAAAGNENTAVIAGIFAEKAKTVFATALDDDNNIIVTVTNAVGSFTIKPFKSMLNVTDPTKQCIGIGDGYATGQRMQFDIYAFHDGDAVCGPEYQQNFADKVAKEAQNNKVPVGDFKTNSATWENAFKNNNYTGRGMRLTEVNGVPHIQVNAHHETVFGYYYNKNLSIDGAHIVIDNVVTRIDGNGDYGSFSLIFYNTSNLTPEAIVRFREDGAVYLRRGAQSATGSAAFDKVWMATGDTLANRVVKGFFAKDAATIIALSRDDNGNIVINLTNEVGSADLPVVTEFTTYGLNTETLRIGLGNGYVGNSSITYEVEFDVLAIHSGADECGFAEEEDPAATVDNLIDAIGTVKANSKEALYAAINAYNALPKDAKARVTKLNTLYAAEAAYRQLAVGTPAVFDENDIVATFGVMSDIHLQQGNANSVKEFQTAIDVTNKLIGENRTLNALLMTGDYTYTGAKDDAEMFLDQLLDNYDTNETALVIAYGNHDTYWTGCMDTAGWYDVLKDAFTFQAADSKPEEGNHHVVVNGIHFITVQPTSYSPNKYPEATKTWLDSVLASITAQTPNAPIFVGTHGPSLDTVYGSDTTLENTIANWGSTTELDAVLNKYPQVVLFSGHTHFGIGVDRAIMQKGYTAVQAGSVTGLDIEGDFANESAASLAEASQGYIVEVDGKGAVRLTRVDYKNGKAIGDAWIIRTPKADGSHLVDYTADRGTTLGPVVDADSITVRPVGNTGVEVSFDYPASSATVYSYNIKLIKNDTVVSELKTLSEWWTAPDGIDTETYRFSGLTEGFPYKVSITATDEWGNVGETVTVVVDDSDEMAAALAAEVDVIISKIGEVTVDSKATIQAARRAYNELNARARAKVTKYAVLTAAEDAYKAFFGSDALFTADGVEKTTYTGVSYENGENGLKVTYTNTGYGNALAIKGAHKLDGAHIVLDNINVTSGYGFAITLSGNEDAPGDYVSGANAIILFEFNKGRIREYPGSGGAVILTSDLLLTENVQSGLEIRFVNENGQWYICIKTDMGEAKAAISATAMNATSLTDKNAVYFALASRSDGFNATMDLVSFHGGETACNTDKLLGDEDAAVQAVDAMIAGIGTVTLDSKATIDAARAAYDNLTDAQKEQVTLYTVLTDAEAAYAALKEAADAADAAIAADVDAMIAKIGTVTLTSESAILAAREAYDALTDAQEAKVTLYSVLIAAEAAYNDLLIGIDGKYTPDDKIVVNPGYWSALTTTVTDKGVTVSFDSSSSIDIRTFGGKTFALDGLHIIITNFRGQGLGVGIVNNGGAEAYNNDGLRFACATNGDTYLLNARWDNTYKQTATLASLTSTLDIRFDKLDDGNWRYTINGSSMVVDAAFVESVIPDPDAVYVQFFQHPWAPTAFTTSSFTVANIHGGEDDCGMSVKDQVIAGEQLKEDLNAAMPGDTVKLTGNVMFDTAIVKPGVTLDLSGYNIEADYFVAFGNVINTGNNAGAVLNVPKDCVMLSADNTYLPVWNGEGYVFVKAPTFQHQAQQNEGALTYTFLPTFDAYVHNLLKAGADVSGVEITVRLTWSPKTGGTAVQDFVYSDALVNDVIDSYADGRYRKAFSITMSNAAVLNNLQYSVVIVSGTGVSFAPTTAPAQV